MDTKYRLLEIDYWIQKIFGIIVLILSITFYGLILAIPFGALQVLSGLIFAIWNKDKKRAIYLLAVATYFLCCFVTLRLSNDYNQHIAVFQFIGCVLCIIPLVLGNWYFRLTAKEYKDLEAQREWEQFNEEQILDA